MSCMFLSMGSYQVIGFSRLIKSQHAVAYNHTCFLRCPIKFVSSASGSVTGTVYGSLENPKLAFTGYVNLRAGVNKISLLSNAVGLPVSILFLNCVR